MTEPIRWPEKVLLFKIEGAYAVDPTPTGAANAILATNVELRPMEGQDLSRNLERPYLGAQPTLPTGLHVVLTFSTELAASGTAGVAPKWGPIARAIGMAQVIVADTSVAYNPISSNMESAYVYLWIGSTLHKMKGSRGGGTIGIDAQGIPVIRWTVMGLFVDPTESAAATPNFTGFQEPLIASSENTPTFTINGVALVLRSYSFDFGNQVEPRLLIGREQIRIRDRSERLNCTVEAVPLTTINPYALAKAKARVPVSIVHGTVAGNIVTIATPLAQVQRLPNLQNNQDVLEWPLALVPQPNAGNDQFTITLT
jgi:hypothetical protein